MRKNIVTTTYEDALAEAFPAAEPGVQPFGSRVLVQIRTPKSKTAGGIILHNESKDTEKWNTQVAKVVAVGPLAFKNRTTQENWPEGSWCSDGDFVRVPKYGGDRWEVPLGTRGTDGGVQTAMFVIFNDLDLIGRVTADPLSIKAFI
jgi:co-chaperonin GroES (HSP10)